MHVMDIASATLSGGVAVGAVADMRIGPAVAFASGTAVGVVSTLGFRKIQSAIHSKIGWVGVPFYYMGTRVMVEKEF